MSAAAIVALFYYAIVILALILLFSFWMITRKKEDDIWRWILTLLGSAVFSTVYWISFWFGSLGTWVLLPFLSLGLGVWLWIFFSHSTHSKLDKSLFSSFGVIAFGMIMFGGYTAGVRDWWWMVLPFYYMTISMLHHMFEPD